MPAAGGSTKVQFTLETIPVFPSDRIMEVFGGRAWSRRQAARSMRRLRSILEENRGRGSRVSIAGR
jgi:hypothetical protein